MEQDAGQTQGRRHARIQVLPQQRRTDEVRRVPRERMVHRFRRHRKRMQDCHRSTLQAVRNDLVAQGSEGAHPTTHASQVESPRAILRIPRKGFKAGRLRSVNYSVTKSKCHWFCIKISLHPPQNSRAFSPNFSPNLITPITAIVKFLLLCPSAPLPLCVKIFIAE